LDAQNEQQLMAANILLDFYMENNTAEIHGLGSKQLVQCYQHHRDFHLRKIPKLLSINFLIVL
jgi:hypothetical protein